MIKLKKKLFSRFIQNLFFLKYNHKILKKVARLIHDINITSVIRFLVEFK